MSNNDMVDININVDAATADYYNKKTKAELIGLILQCQLGLRESAREIVCLKSDVKQLLEKEEKNRLSLRQAESMVTAIVDSW